MTNPVTTATNVVDALGGLLDAIAGLPPGELKQEVGLVVTAGVSLGVLHLANASATIDAVTAVILTVASVGIALERVFKAAKTP